MSFVSADEVDQISTRTLAVARYKHNHDWMNDIFCQAAYRIFEFINLSHHFVLTFLFPSANKATQPQISPFSVFSMTDIEEKTVCDFPFLFHA